MSEGSLNRALALALTGEDLELGNDSDLASALSEAGFDVLRLAEIRSEQQMKQQAWPFQVPIEDRAAIGFARFDAALARVRSELGLSGLVPATPAKRALNRDEQRLAAERPPHWG